MSYQINGVEYPSVTQVLGEVSSGDGLIQWAANSAVDYVRDNIGKIDLSSPHALDNLLSEAKTAYKKISDTAKDIGTMTHDIISKYIKSGQDASGDYPDEVQNAFLSFLEWEKNFPIEWQKSELTCISENLGFGGTIDAIARINGYLYVVDFKVSKKLYASHSEQVAAYKLLYEEHTGEIIHGCSILRLDKETGEPEYKDVSADCGRRQDSFLKLLDWWYTAKNRRLKNNPYVIKYKEIYKK